MIIMHIDEAIPIIRIRMRESGWRPKGITKYLNTPKLMNYEEYEQCYGVESTRKMLREFLEDAWIEKKEIIKRKRA